MPWRASRYCNRRHVPTRPRSHCRSADCRSQRNALVHKCDTGVHDQWRSAQQPIHALSMEPSTRIFERRGVPRLLSQHVQRFSTEAKHTSLGDLLPRNILVEDSKITAILDWETAGYYPEFWEYCQMHDPGWMAPAWACVLGRIFPGPRREKESKPWGRLFVISITTIRAWASVAPAPVSLASTRSSIVQPKLLLPISSTPSGACQRYAIQRSVSGDLRGFTTIFWFRIPLCRSLCAPEGYSMGYMSFDCTTVYQYWD
jgi:hypothetical protein